MPRDCTNPPHCFTRRDDGSGKCFKCGYVRNKWDMDHAMYKFWTLQAALRLAAKLQEEES